MKVCHLMTNFVRGGATKYIVDLIEGIDAKHFLVCGSGSDKEFVSEVKAKSKVDIFLMHKNPVMLFFSLFSLYFFFRKNKFDIIHTNSTEAGFVGRIAGKLSGSKVIHTAHAAPFETRGFLLIVLERIAANFCDVIIDVSPRIKKLYEEKGIGVGKHKVIPVGVDVKKFHKASKIKIPGKGFRVVMVSRLVKGKGVEDFIELAKSFKKHSFIIVGDGPLKNISHGKNVFFLGFRNDTHRILKACNVLVLMSKREGFPLVIYEAMAAGLPVISKNIGGVSDIVKDGVNGFLVNNVKEAEKALSRLTVSSARKMGEKGHSAVKDNTIEKMVKDTKRVYANI